MCGRCVNNHACTGRSTWYDASRLKKNKSFRPFLRRGARQKKALKRHNSGSCFLQFKGTNKKNRSCDRLFLCQAYACQILCLLCNFYRNCVSVNISEIPASFECAIVINICIYCEICLSFFCKSSN